MKLLDVLYLFPGMIECEINGNSSSVFVYINYKDQEIIVPDATGIDDVEGFKATVGSCVFRKTFVKSATIT